MDELNFNKPIGESIDGPKVKAPFKADLYDFMFAVFAFVLGYLFSRWVLFRWQGWGVAVFTVLYLGSVSLYLVKKGIKQNSAALFWLLITLLTGLSYALWDEIELSTYRALFLFCSAAYWMLCASSTLLSGKTGNRLFLDGINAVILIPLKNLACQYKSFGYFGGLNKLRLRKLLSVILGIVLAVIVLSILLPLLMRADSGGFTKIIDFLAKFLSIRNKAVITFMVYAIPAIPASAYIFGLVYGSTAKRGHDTFKKESLDKASVSIRIFAPSTVYIVLCAVGLLYVTFILSQLPYFFSAFTGKRPEGWLIYSEYARQGFFELCRIAGLNLTLLAIADMLCRKKRRESKMLKILNIALALLTLLIIATAFSKMVLYINVYGLTMRRLLPCMFMIFMIIACIGVIALQRWDFSVIRVTLVSASVIFCAFCLSDPDGMVVRYNTGRYLEGTLAEYDTEILYRSGSAAVLPALEVYENTLDGYLKDKVGQFLRDQRFRLGDNEEVFTYSIQSGRAEKALVDYILE